MLTVKSRDYETTMEQLASPADSQPMTFDEMRAAAEIRGNAMRMAIRVWRNTEVILGLEDDAERRAITRHVIVEGFGKTPNLAATYLFNIRNGMYSSNKKWNKKDRDRKREEKQTQANTSVVDDSVTTEQPGNEPEQVATVEHEQEQTQSETDDDNRWGVLDKDIDKVLQTFTSRDQAARHNRELKEAGRNTRIWDREKDLKTA